MENGSGGFWEGAGPSEEDSRPASGGVQWWWLSAPVDSILQESGSNGSWGTRERIRTGKCL